MTRDLLLRLALLAPLLAAWPALAQDSRGEPSVQGDAPATEASDQADRPD